MKEKILKSIAVIGILALVANSFLLANRVDAIGKDRDNIAKKLATAQIEASIFHQHNPPTVKQCMRSVEIAKLAIKAYDFSNKKIMERIRAYEMTEKDEVAVVQGAINATMMMRFAHIVSNEKQYSPLLAGSMVSQLESECQKIDEGDGV